MAFLTHDISMLRLFETFLENAPQLAVLLYSVLRTNKAEPSQGAGPGMGGRGCAGLTVLEVPSHSRPSSRCARESGPGPVGPHGLRWAWRQLKLGGTSVLGQSGGSPGSGTSSCLGRAGMGKRGGEKWRWLCSELPKPLLCWWGASFRGVGGVWSRTSPPWSAFSMAAVLFAGMGICTAFLCVTWSLLDYHQSLRSFLQDKYEMGWGSSVIYFLWNLFLLCPRILALALFALLWPYGVAVHFPLVWLAMFIWVSLQGTDFMESPGPEQLYRAMVAVILYFSWFNVAPGRTLYRSIIYHSFILLDSTLLTLAWLWGHPPEEQRPYLIPVLCAALPCYLLGLLLRITYYGWLHPNVRAQPRSGGDEVDAEGRHDGVVEFRSISEPSELRSVSGPDLVNSRLRCLARSHFPLSALAEPRLLNGAAAV